MEAVKQCAIAGMGAAVLPRIAIGQELAQKKLVPVRWQGAPLLAYTQMLRLRERWITPALEGLWTLAHKYFGIATAAPDEELAGAPSECSRDYCCRVRESATEPRSRRRRY